MRIEDFIKNTENKFGMTIKNSDDLIFCLEGYDYFYDVYYECIIDALKECINDVRLSGKPFENIDELINHISHHYI